MADQAVKSLLFAKLLPVFAVCYLHVAAFVYCAFTKVTLNHVSLSMFVLFSIFCKF